MINYIFFTLSFICAFYTFLVNRKLNNLKNFVEEFKNSFYQFNNAIEKITQHIADFKDMNKHSALELEQKVTQAVLLINELQIINDSVVQQIEELEKKLKHLKNANRPHPAHSEKYLLHKSHNETTNISLNHPKNSDTTRLNDENPRYAYSKTSTS